LLLNAGGLGKRSDWKFVLVWVVGGVWIAGVELLPDAGVAAGAGLLLAFVASGRWGGTD
jgi:hypothetical protein